MWRGNKTVFGGVIVFLASVCLFLTGCSSKEKRVYRVGILCGLEYLVDIPVGFKQKMAEMGYVENDNIYYDLQITNFEPAKEKQILKKLVEDNVDLIFTCPTEASIRAKKIAKGTGTPVLFACANIEETGLVDSVRHPGGNITGVRYPGPDIAIKRFEILLELVPEAKAIMIPYQRAYPIVASQINALRPVARALNIRLNEFPASDADELRANLDATAAAGMADVDAILFIAEPLAVTPQTFTVIAEFAAKHQLPVGGALMSAGQYHSLFGVNLNAHDAGRQAALLADKILNGIPAGTIPVVTADNYIEINYLEAQRLGLKVNEGLLSIANRIIR
jgi:putative ABC transport system substrate-binding protein